MRLLTWNVNSITARLERVLEALEAHKPDIACIQETKVGPAAFPHLALQSAGYAAADRSGGRWCGVAVLAPLDAPLTGIVDRLPGEPDPDEARWVEAMVGDIRAVSVYVPNGQAVGTEPYVRKLAFLDAMRARVAELAGRPLLVMGDMNVAPTDLDVYDPAAFVGDTHVTTAEREGLAAVLDAGGLTDGYRSLHPDEGEWAHTWWDYRAGHYHKRMGMRIDHALLGGGLADRLREASVDRMFRKGTKPSDHAPLVLDLD